MPTPAWLPTWLPHRARRARGASALPAARAGRPAGACRSREDLRAGLADTIITAAIAMSGITADVDEARSHLEWRLDAVAGRSATATWG